jgi:predicted TIM-barrel fold metal-dependent hydrolase
MPEQDNEYYHRVDMQVYRDEIAPILPPEVLDIHTHVWSEALAAEKKYNRYAATDGYRGIPNQYGYSELDHSGRTLFPDRTYHAVCFGSPFPEAVQMGTNDEVSSGAREWPHRYPLLVATPADSTDKLRQILLRGRFYGIKVAVNLEPHAYATDRVTHVFSEAQRRVADEFGLMVMLHIPRASRLADPEHVADILQVCSECPKAYVMLAHLGRSYCTWSIRDSIHSLKDVPNLYWDVSFVQNAMVYEILFENVDSRRVLFGTDLPVADVRGHRVCVNGQWVDVTRDRYSWAAFRREGQPIEATFMAYEIIRALREGAERAGLDKEQLRAIFFSNGMGLIEDIRNRLAPRWLA